MITTDFNILSGVTVSSNFQWGGSYPVLSAVPANTISNYISGYAPGLSVCFINQSNPDILNTGDELYYTWDFGDFYNQSTNTIITSSSTSMVYHLYTMPGIYNVTLTQQKKVKTTTIPSLSVNNCFGRYCINWTWNNLQSNSVNYLKWKDVSSQSTVNKTTKWAEIPIYGSECNNSNFSLYTYNITKISAINVIETSPIANLTTIYTPATGVSPFTIEMSPSGTICGSFPIEKIVWDFGDGSTPKIVSRYNTPDLTIFTNTNTFSSDINDPRNYNATYTYKRTEISTFYPSITAYCMNTNQNSISQTTVGSINLPSISATPIRLLKVRNDINGNLYGIQIGNNFGLVTTLKNRYIPTNYVVYSDLGSPFQIIVIENPIARYGTLGTQKITNNIPPQRINVINSNLGNPFQLTVTEDIITGYGTLGIEEIYTYSPQEINIIIYSNLGNPFQLTVTEDPIMGYNILGVVKL